MSRPDLKAAGEHALAPRRTGRAGLPPGLAPLAHLAADQGGDQEGRQGCHRRCFVAQGGPFCQGVKNPKNFFHHKLDELHLL